MKYVKPYVIFLVVVMLAGIGAIIYVGIKPKPISKIDLSGFQSTAEYSKSLDVRLNQEIKDSPILFLGVEADNIAQTKLWKEFLDLLPPGEAYDQVILDKLVSSYTFFDKNQVIDMKEQGPELIKFLQDAKAQNKRTVVIAPSIFVSQLIPKNPTGKILEKSGLSITSFSLASFPESREQEKLQNITCDTNVNDEKGTAALGCIILQVARSNYRKHLTGFPYVGIVNQVGLRDYLMMINEKVLGQ